MPSARKIVLHKTEKRYSISGIGEVIVEKPGFLNNTFALHLVGWVERPAQPNIFVAQSNDFVGLRFRSTQPTNGIFFLRANSAGPINFELNWRKFLLQS